LAAVAAGAIGRALATRNTTDDRRGTAARVGIGVLAGVSVAELATTVLLGGTVDRELDVRAHADAERAPAVVTARAEYD
ncbi:hypothetical protein, partial [Streptomyces sp. JW3]